MIASPASENTAVSSSHASARQAFGLKIVLAVGLIGGFLLSPKLWISTRFYPLSPVWSKLPAIGHPWDRVWFGALLALLVGVVVHPRPRWLLTAFCILAGMLSLWDQSRWQPWFYQYLFMSIALAAFPWRNPQESPLRAEAALNACRVIMAGMYFWSGLQKLNPLFLDDVFPWLIEPIVPRLPEFLQAKITSTGIASPFVEAGLGLALLIRPLRHAAVFGLIVMHALLLFCLGPLGHNWNTVVWPWNIAMALMCVVLFWQTKSVST